MKPSIRLRAATWPAIAIALVAASWAASPHFGRQTPAANLVANPGFEKGLDQWPLGSLPPDADTGVETALDREVRHGGTASLRFRKSRKSFFPIGLVRQSFRVNSSERKLKVGVWVKASGVGKATMGVDFGEGVEWGAYIDGGATHDWKHYTAVLAIPPGSSEVTVMLQMYGAGTVWMDDVSARYVPANTALKM